MPLTHYPHRNGLSGNYKLRSLFQDIAACKDFVYLTLTEKNGCKMYLNV